MSSPALNRREYPSAPIVGVAGVIVRGGRILLIQRGREPMMGRWSLPGGALELGETMSDGVAREILEETGLRVRPIEILSTIDRIPRDEAGHVRYHYVLIDWICAERDDPTGAALVSGDDAANARWVGGEQIRSEAYSLDAMTLQVVDRAIERAEALGL